MPVSIVVVHSSARSGLMVEYLTPQLGDFFGAKNGKGVLVRSVEERQPRRASRVPGRRRDCESQRGIRSATAATSLMPCTAARASAVTVSIIREKKEQNLTLTVPERNQSKILDTDETLEVPDADAETVIDLERRGDPRWRA